MEERENDLRHISGQKQTWPAFPEKKGASACGRERVLWRRRLFLDEGWFVIDTGAVKIHAPAFRNKPVELIDIGVNLTHSSFRHDLSAVIERAVAAGVVQMVVTGTDSRASVDAQALASRHPGILYSTGGVHPHAARHWTDAMGRLLAELAAAPEVVALGEMGLDFYRDYSPRPDQERAFQAQLELACDLSVPVFLHERDAGRRFFPLLERYRDRLPKAVLHCFTGGRDELAACRDLDLHVGVTGWICDERRGLHLRDLIPLVPADRLMLETDAPFILPRDLTPRPKNRRNEPAFLPHVLKAVSETLAQQPDEVASATTATARNFFGLPDVPKGD